MKHLKISLFLIIIFNLFINISTSHSQNFYKYPKTNVSGEKCEQLLNKMNMPNPNYEKNSPTVVSVDFLVERIFEINGKDMEFETFFSLWYDWNEIRLKDILIDLDLYNDVGKRSFLCSYNPILLWGSGQKLFYPVIEFYNKKSKTNMNQGGDADWVDIYSDGNVGTRLRDNATFSADFDFRRFPFDTQKLSFELWSEYPSTLIEIIPEPISMSAYKENSYRIDGVPIQIPGWKVNEVDHYTYEYLDDDGMPYQGLYVTINIARQSSYYLFKIILPIIFILVISWSVFWVRGSQLEAKVNVTIVCLLSLIAYNFIIDEDLPKLAYLTFLDSFILLSYFYTGIATILCVTSFVQKLKSGKDLSIIDKKAQWFGPLSYFLILFAMLIYFYNIEGVGAMLAKVFNP